VAVLRRTYAAYRLDVAGPPVDFHADTALAAARFTQHACWFLVSDAQPPADLDQALKMPGPPRRPEHHLSADLLFRYLPQVHRRAVSLNPADRLPALLATVLRQWPLSGILSAVEEGPLTAPAFGHPGLQLFYAERLAANEKPAWFPDPAGLAYVEWLWQELGKDPSLLPRGEAVAVGEGAHA
jgi:hypothetical protein